MGEIADGFDEAFRDFNVDGVVGSGRAEVDKALARLLGAMIEVGLSGAITGITQVSNVAARDAFFASADNQNKLAYVNNNNGSASDPANGVYEFVSGAARLAVGFYTGVASVVQPLVNQANAAAAQAIAANANLQAVQVIGRPVDPTSDTSTISTARVIGIDGYQGTAVGALASVKVYAAIATNITFYRYNSANAVQATSVSIALTPGLNTILASAITPASGDVRAVNPGDKLAFATSVANAVTYNTSAGADGQGFGTISGTTITPLNAARVQMQFNINYQSVTATSFVALFNTASANALAVALLSAALSSQRGPQVIGRTGVPSGASLAGNQTFIWNQQVEEAGILNTIRFDAAATGNITVARYTLNTSTQVMTRVASQVFAVGATGVQTVAIGMTVAKGEYLAVYGNGIVKYNSPMTADGGGWWQVGTGAPAAPTVGSATTTQRLEVGFDLSVLKVTTTSVAGPLSGKKFGLLGDSISTQNGLSYAAQWIAPLLARTGGILQRVDARPGRTYRSALEGYGASAPLADTASLTGYAGATATTGTRGVSAPSSVLSYYNSAYNAVDGTTLAQWLADLDFLIIWLGTNDARTAAPGTPSYSGGVGTISDAYTANTFHGAMNFVLDAIQKARPDLRVLLVTHYQTKEWYDYPTGRAYADAIQAQGDMRGMPVLDLYKNSGVNGINYATWLTNDGGSPVQYIHPLPAFSQQVIGPAIAEFAKRWK